MYIKIMLFLIVMILSATLFSLKINAQEEEEQEEDYYSIYDEYSHNYDKKYFKDNALKINAITNMTKANNMLLSLHQLPDKNLDRSQLLASESRIGFVLPTFTM